MRNNLDATIEVLSSTVEIGELYPARRMHESIDTETGLVQWSEGEACLCFDINGVIPESDRLYLAWKARQRGLVNGKKVWMLEDCCGPIHDRTSFGVGHCDIIFPTVLTFSIRVHYTEYTRSGPGFPWVETSQGDLGTLSVKYKDFESQQTTTTDFTDSLCLSVPNDPFGCLWIHMDCWGVPTGPTGPYDGGPAVLFTLSGEPCNLYPSGDTGNLYLLGECILPISNNAIADSVGNGIYTFVGGSGWGISSPAVFAFRECGAGNTKRLYQYIIEGLFI
jgi:hypothetical protein